MSELEDLIAIHGAVDRAVAENPILAPEVAKFVGAYHDPRAVGWYDEFLAWNGERDIAPDLRDLESALASLSDPSEPTKPRMAARRILAVKLATIVRPDLVDGPRDLIINALNVAGLDEGNVGDLAGLILDRDVFGSMSQWEQLITTAESAGLINSALAMQRNAPPCDGHVVEIPTPGSPWPAAELHTIFPADGISFECACRFLEPSNWPGCSSFWCEMDKRQGFRAPNGNPIYHEIVSLACQSRQHTWWAETYLEFSFIKTADSARVSYLLSSTYAPPHPQVVIDQGWLTVRRVGAGIEVETLKRVKFTYGFTGPMLAAMMCALGYAQAAHDLVFNCAHDCDGTAGTDFPAAANPDIHTFRKIQTPERRKHPSGGGSGGGVGGGVGGVIDDAVGKITGCMNECSDAYLGAYAKMGDGTYTADDLVTDVTRMWTRYLRDGATALDLATRAAVAVRADAAARADAVDDAEGSR